jgi:large repetitive protein
VVITGTNLTGATAVKFGTITAAYTVNSATKITATVPTGAIIAKIAVTTPGGTVTSSTNFTIVAAPTITSFTPTSGPIGASVVITGTNLTGATAVKFGTITAAYTVNSATKITATVPTGAITAKIAVTTPGGTVTSSTNFTKTP